MKEKFIRVGVADIALLVLCVAFLLGMLLFFGPCGIEEDGTWRVCHWAGRAVTGLSAALAVLSLFHTLLPAPGIRQGLDLGVVTVAALTVLLPGRFIDLCQWPGVRCHTVMVPAVRLFAALIALAALLDFFIQIGRGISREARRRKERKAREQEAQKAEAVSGTGSDGEEDPDAAGQADQAFNGDSPAPDGGDWENGL